MTIFKQLAAILFAIIGIFFYGKKQGRNNREAEENSQILKDIRRTKETDNFVDALTPDEVDARMRIFTRKKTRKQPMLHDRIKDV
jgi:hypothetical protein